MGSRRTKPATTTNQEQTQDYIEQLYSMQPEPEFRVKDYAPMLSDEVVVSELNERSRELSPQAKLRILQRKLENQRRLE